MPPYLSVLVNKEFRSLWFSQITSQIAINMLLFVLVLRVYETTTSNTAVAFLILSMGTPAIFFGVLAGTLVDRWDKRNVMIITNLIRMVLILGFFISSETSPWIYLLVVLISITTQFFVPSEAPTIPRIVPKSLLLSANSLFTLTLYSSVITGFVLSGPALKFFGPHNVFLFLACLLALAAFFVTQMSPETKEIKEKIHREEIIRVWHEFIDGLRRVKQEKQLIEPIFLLTASQTLIASLASLAPGFAQQVLAIEIKDASYLVMGPAAIGMVLGSVWVGHFGRKMSKKTMINLGVILAGIFLIFLSAIVKFTHLSLAVTSLFLLGTANALIDVPSNTIIQENAQADMRGRVYGLLTSLIGGAAILPVALIGVAADLFGVGMIILLIALLILSYGIYRIGKEKYNK